MNEPPPKMARSRRASRAFDQRRRTVGRAMPQRAPRWSSMRAVVPTIMWTPVCCRSVRAKGPRGGTRPAVILGRGRRQVRQGLPRVVVDFQLTTGAPAVEQRLLAKLQKPAHRAHRRGGHAPQARRNAVHSPASCVEQHDLNPRSQSRVPCRAPRALHSPLHPARQSDYNGSNHAGPPGRRAIDAAPKSGGSFS